MDEETRVPEIKNILQIIPADDWYFRFKGHDLDGRQRLACWALCEDSEGKHFVVGMTLGPEGNGTLVACHKLIGFSGYEFCEGEKA